MPDRIAIVEPSGRGGIAQYTWCLARSLDRRGVEVALVTADPYEWRSEPPVAATHTLFRGRRTSPIALLRLILTLRRRGVRTWHLQSGSRPGWLAGFAFALRALRAGRIVVTAHNAAPHNSGFGGRMAARALYRAADRIVVHGEAVAADVRRLAPRRERVETAPFGGMEALPLPPPARELPREEILFFGYIHPAKGLADLIRAAGILRRRGLPAPLRIAGRLEEPWGPYADLLRAEGLDDAIVELGYVDAARIPELFARAAVVALPHREASQSGVLHLAARFGAPVTATRAGGLVDQVAHGETGWLVDPADPAALADGLEAVLRDSALARRLADGARERFRGPAGMNATAARMLEVYGIADSAARDGAPARADVGDATAPPMVSVIVPVRNEAAHIDACLDAVLAQDYPAGRLEVLVADGRSDDDTRARVLARSGGAVPVRLIDNPGGIVPSGMNAALALARGEIVVRVDGHTRIASDYVREGVRLLRETGAAGVGGGMRATGTGATGRAIAAATSSPLGVGDAVFHYADRETEAESVYMGIYPADLLRRLGGYDEELVRNQDDELNARIRAAGGRLVLSPRLRSTYACRGSLDALWRQYFEYGSWKVRSLRKTPKAFRLRHLVPPAFVAGLVAGAPLIVASPALRPVYAAVLLLYVALALAETLRSRRAGAAAALLPVALVVLHVAYGAGMWHGLIRFRGGSRPARPCEVSP